MNTAKAQEAVDKSLEHKLIAAAMAEAAEEPIGGATMQPKDGFVNPYGRIGAMPPGPYSLTNSLN
mgnify:FL=1|tara:strand:- start:182 stop:376 length:195 start_codon:yes stop_codon:yes gene_type:complete